MSRSQHKIAKANNLSNLFFILCPKVNSPIAVPSFAYNHIPSCPIILTVCIQMQVRRLISFSRISIPCQKSPLVRLAVRPQIDFFSLLILVLPTVTERVVVFAVRFYLTAKGLFPNIFLTFYYILSFSS